MLNPPSADISYLSANVLFDISTDSPSIVVTNQSEGDTLANVSWWFEVYSPNGNPIHAGLESAPDVTGEWTTHTLSDNWGRPEWSGAPYTFTIYAKDSAGNIYSKTYSAVICRPNGAPKSGSSRRGAASTNMQVQCDRGKILFQNQTNSSYKGLTGSFVSSVLRVVYPIDETGSIPTPFSINSFTNASVPITYSSKNYQFVAYQVYDYVLSDNTSVRIKYYEQKTFPVYCNINLFPLICEYNALVDSVENGSCASASAADEKLKLINSKLAIVLMGMMQPLTGVDVPKMIQEIEEIGGFTCNCCDAANSAGIPQATSSVIDNYTFSVTTLGGDVVGSFANSVGNNIVLELYDRTYIFNIGASTLENTTAFSVTPSISGYTKTYSLNVDLPQLATDLATVIEDNPDVYNLWKALFGQEEALKIVVDGRCVFSNASACDYVFSLENIPANTTYAILSSVKAGGVIKNTNYSFNLTNLSGLQSYLNALGVGTFVVTDLTGGAVSITSDNNSFDLSSITYKIASTTYDADMERTCTGYTPVSLDEFAAYIINYICDLNTSQIQVSGEYEIVWIDSNGFAQTTIVADGSSLMELLNEIVSKANQTVQYVHSLGAVNCQTIRNQFPSNTALEITATDFALGTKNGQCSRIPYLDLFNYMLTAGYSDLATLNKFCAMVTKCGAGEVCEPFSYIDYIMTDYDTSCTQATGITYTIS